MIEIKSAEEIELMEEAGRIVALVLEEMGRRVKPGVSTLELDGVAEEIIRGEGAAPAFKGYYGFPASICASLNHEVVHGIPRKDVILKEGDIISIDVGSLKNGFHGDAARTFAVGRIPEARKRLIDVCRRALDAGVAQAKPGNRVGDIGAAIQKSVEDAGFSVVREWVGHGIGRKLHEDPQIPNFGSPGTGAALSEGMALAIEPMVNEGTYKTEVLDDKWTVVTADRRLSAHFENTVVVASSGARVLTERVSEAVRENKEKV